jgi:endogenous inhibitor of DNA gyrase (YacG/DUF329 family)
MATGTRGGAAASGCPICSKALPPVTARPTPDPFPFCSSRCQLVDLGRWLGEEYRIPDRDTVVWSAPDAGGDDDGR